ncbi:hypothetical protein C8J56DRAFT_1049817 [Mycena floridula]|nr:hypothetical protein C8J56DRAFT_1049817 [Mycena floridula]
MPALIDSEPSISTTSTKGAYKQYTLIPLPNDQTLASRYTPLALRLPVVLIVPGLMMAAGIALEIGLYISEKNGGYPVPQRNVFAIASQQFLLSFIPTILVIPLGYVWRQLDWYIRVYQPYVVLSHGNAKAEESLLLDYLSLGSFLSILYAMRYKHRIVLWSAVTALITYIWQPLAGSMFQIQQRPQTDATTVTSIKAIGLAPDFDQLNGFVAAAGFADAAVFNGLGDPPFVINNWASAEFVFPTWSGFNGSMVVNTTGIKTTANCDNPVSQPTITGSDQTFTIKATSVDGCEVPVTFNPTLAARQYGVINTGACGPTAGFNITQQAVMFFHTTDAGTPEARAVFCSPTIEAHTVMDEANIDNGALTSATLIGVYSEPNNVTGPPLNGQAFNAVIFENNTNPFIQARATATNSGVSGAIFRFASQKPGGPQSVFNNPNGFLDITTKIYTQHLSLSAKSVYFVSANSTLKAFQTSFVPRLTINPLPAHPMAFSLFGVGILGLVLHLVNRRQRRRILLINPPGTIASAVALAAHSEFGQLLLPYDNEDTILEKLKNLRFRLDRRTGAIVATENDEDFESGGKKSLDDPTRALLGGHSRKSSSSMTYIGHEEEIPTGTEATGSLAKPGGLSTNLGSGDPPYDIQKVVPSDNATQAVSGGLSRTSSLKYFPSQEIPRELLGEFTAHT